MRPWGLALWNASWATGKKGSFFWYTEYEEDEAWLGLQHEMDPLDVNLSTMIFSVSQSTVFICLWKFPSSYVGYVEVKGQFTGVNSLLPPCGPWRYNSGCRPWWQVPLLFWAVLPVLTSTFEDMLGHRKSIYCSCRRPGFRPQYWLDSSQHPVTPIPDLIPSSGFLRHQAHKRCTYLHAGKTLTHINQFFQS